MTREQAAKSVIRAFEAVLTDPEITVKEESNIMDDLELDSIALQDVLSELEDEFDIEISDSMLRKMIHVRDVIDILSQVKEA